MSEPKYKVDSKTERLEIRTYSITLVAQIKLETEFEKAVALPLVNSST